MTDRTGMWAEVVNALQRARGETGTVHPRYSYLERLVNAAFSDNQLLADLHRRITQDGGLQNV
jgi:predicted transcriptional regulator